MNTKESNNCCTVLRNLSYLSSVLISLRPSYRSGRYFFIIFYFKYPPLPPTLRIRLLFSACLPRGRTCKDSSASASDLMVNASLCTKRSATRLVFISSHVQGVTRGIKICGEIRMIFFSFLFLKRDFVYGEKRCRGSQNVMCLIDAEYFSKVSVLFPKQSFFCMIHYTSVLHECLPCAQCWLKPGPWPWTPYICYAIFIKLMFLIYCITLYWL